MLFQLDILRIFDDEKTNIRKLISQSMYNCTVLKKNFYF